MPPLKHLPTKSDTVSDLDEDADSPSLTQPDSTPMSTPEEMTEDLDQLEAENYGLRQEVTELKEKAPTRTQKLEAEVDALRLELQERAAEVDELKERIRFLEGEHAEHNHERESTFNSYRSQISTLRASVNDWIAKHGEERRRASFWERQAKALGWQPGGKQ